MTNVLCCSAPSAPPRNVEVTFVNSSSIRIRWTSPAVVNKNGLIRYYIIKFTSLSDNKTVNYNASSANKEITGLGAYKTYIFRIAAFTTATGPFSDTIKLQTLQDGSLTTYIHVHVSVSVSCNLFCINSTEWVPTKCAHCNSDIYISNYEVDASRAIKTEWGDLWLHNTHQTKSNRQE